MKTIILFNIQIYKLKQIKFSRDCKKAVAIISLLFGEKPFDFSLPPPFVKKLVILRETLWKCNCKIHRSLSFSALHA